MLYTGRLLHSRHLLGMRVQQVGSTVTWPYQKCRAHAGVFEYDYSASRTFTGQRACVTVSTDVRWGVN